MVDRFICYFVLIVIPATLLATLWRVLSIEVALAIVWATTLLSIVIGTVEYLKNPEAYDRPGR
jgi:hypothetical protein